jgi:hypothetical protein
MLRKVPANPGRGTVEPSHEPRDTERCIHVRAGGVSVDRVVAVGVEVLVAEIGPERVERARELAVEGSRVKNRPDRLGVPNQHALVQDFVFAVDLDAMNRGDGFANCRRPGRKREIVVEEGKSELQARNLLGPHEQASVDLLAVIRILVVLRGLHIRSTPGPAIAHLEHIVQSQLSGGNLARQIQADILHGQNAARIIERIDEGAIDRGFQELAFVEGSVVIADPGVHTADRRHEVIALAVAQQEPFNVYLDVVAALRNEQRFSQRGDLVREASRHEQIQRAELKRVGHVVVPLIAHVAEDIEMQPWCDLVHRGRLNRRRRRLGCGRRRWSRSRHRLRTQLLNLVLQLLNALQELLVKLILIRR